MKLFFFSLLIFCRQDTFSTPLPFFSQTTELHLLTLETTGRRRRFRRCLLGSKKKTLPKNPKGNFTINTFYPPRLASENEIFLPFNAPGRRIFPFLSSSQLPPPLKTINFHLLFPLVRQPMRRMATNFFRRIGTVVGWFCNRLGVDKSTGNVTHRLIRFSSLPRGWEQGG